MQYHQQPPMPAQYGYQAPMATDAGGAGIDASSVSASACEISQGLAERSKRPGLICAVAPRTGVPAMSLKLLSVGHFVAGTSGATAESAAMPESVQSLRHAAAVASRVREEQRQEWE